VVDLDGPDSVSSSDTPNAILDTNVFLAIYSWHDVVSVTNAVLEAQPAATLEHAAIQFRVQRARAAFALTLFLNEYGWSTGVALNEIGRTLEAKAPPTDPEQGVASNFVRLYAHFIKDKLLPAWRGGGDEEADAKKKGNDVDRICLAWAEQHRVPLISWEGHGPNGFDPNKLIPLEAAKRGIDLVTPEELLRRERFDGTAAAQHFFSGWAEQGPLYVLQNPGARETMEVALHFYRRMARNDWTP
jgi:hypothetical protein